LRGSIAPAKLVVSAGEDRVRKFILAVAATTAIAGSTSAHAQDDFAERFYAQVGDWTVRKLKTAHSGCHTYRQAIGGGLYGMTFGQGRPVMLSFTLPNLASKGRSTREFEVRFVPRGSQQERSWGKYNFTSVEMETGGTIFLSELVPVNFLDAFAANGALRIYADGKLLTMLPLDGTEPAVTKLRECAAAVALQPTK
jgi:hypothetical protein